MPTLYAARGGSSNSNLYTVDPSTGAMTSVGPTGFALSGLAFDLAGTVLYGATSNASPSHPGALITINPATGVGTLVGAMGAVMADITFAPDGTLYGWEAGSRALFTINTTTGVATLVGIESTYFTLTGLALEIDEAANGYWFPNRCDTGSPIFHVDLATVAVAQILTISNGISTNFPAVSAASFGADAAMWAVAMPQTSAHSILVKIAADGMLTQIGDMGFNQVDALAWQGSVKPNPWFVKPPFNPNTLLAARGSSYGTSDLYSVDPATGVLTSIGPIGFAITGLAQDPITQTLYGITSRNSAVHPQSLITIDPVTGAGTFVAAENTRNPWTDIAFSSFGQLFAQGQSAKLLQVDKATAVGTVIGTHSGSTFGGGLAIDSTDVGYSAFNGSSTAEDLYSVNLGSGVYTAVALFNGAGVGSSGWAIPAAGFDGSDVLWAADGDNPGGPVVFNLVTIDTATATVTIIAPFSLDGVDALCWAQTATVTDDFSVALTPNALTIFRGNNDTSALTTVITAGVAQSITLSDTGAPIGVSLAYAANPIMSGGGTTVTVTVTGAATPGIYPIAVHAVGTEATHVATLTVTVPGPLDDAYSVNENRTLTVVAPGVMANDIDPTTVSLNTGPSHGSLILNPDGSFSYTPNSGYVGVDTWTYNGNGGTATVTITISVRDPTAVFDGAPGFKVAA